MSSGELQLHRTMRLRAQAGQVRIILAKEEKEIDREIDQLSRELDKNKSRQKASAPTGPSPSIAAELFPESGSSSGIEDGKGGPLSTSDLSDSRSDDRVAFLSAHAATAVYTSGRQFDAEPQAVHVHGTASTSAIDGPSATAEPAAGDETMPASPAQPADRERLLGIGRKRFNKKPADGISFLEERGVLEHTPDAHALFITGTPGLAKASIGEYLGSSEVFVQAVVASLLARMPFSQHDLVACLRMFLQVFRLPGEAQKIDRLIEAFARRYVQENPGLFANADTPYVLCFALIMLQTDLHNPAIKRKMTFKQFAERLRGIDNGQDVHEALLRSMFECIEREPIRLEADIEPSTFSQPDKHGYLRKQGGRVKSWRRRWFLLTGQCLYYFKTRDATVPKGILPLENLAVRRATLRANCFEIYSPFSNRIKTGKMEGQTIEEGHHASLFMCADTAEEAEDWMAVIERSMANNPMYALLVAAKQRVARSSSFTS